MTTTAEHIITCPRCRKRGRLNAFHPKGSTEVKYYVGHEGLGYDWGTSHKASERVEAIRRCYLIKPSHRHWARSILGV